MHLQTMKLFLVFVLLKGVHCQAIWGPEAITVMEHEDLIVECRYQKGYENYEKYWCEGSRHLSCSVLARTTSSYISRSGLFLSENKTKRVINIIMKDIQEREEGTYRCGISATGRDEHSPVVVKVKKALPITPTKVEKTVSSTAKPGTTVSTTSLEESEETKAPVTEAPDQFGVWTVLRWILLCVLLSCPIFVTCWEKWCRCGHLSSQPVSEPGSQPSC